MLSYPTLPGDIDHLVADDHAVVERQFQRLEAGTGNRRILVEQVCFELAMHASAEERVLYPALLEAGMQQLSDEARAEHQHVKELVATLEHADPGEEAFASALAQLIAEVRHHVQDEEGRVLPDLRTRLGAERLGVLGKEFLAAKRAAPTHAHPNAPDSGAAHTLLDKATALLDRGRDKASGRAKELATDASGLLDPQAQRLLDAFSSLEPKPPEILEPEQARRQPSLVDATRLVLAEDHRPVEPEPVAHVEDRTIPGPGGGLRVRVYRATTAGAAGTGVRLPMLLWIHGGGWVLYDVDTYDASCRGLVNKTGAIVVSPEYRRAPEHPFPAAYDDVAATWRWMRDHAAELGGDPSRMSIGGESVGATMAVATARALVQAGEPRPSCQVLVYPLTTTEPFGSSGLEEADARPLNLPLLSWMAMHAFDGAPQGLHDPRVALLDLGPDQLAGLPPTLVVTAGRDPLRDQGQEFARHLDAAGVMVQVAHYDGVMHEFFGAAAVLDAADDAQRRAATLIASCTAA